MLLPVSANAGLVFDAGYGRGVGLDERHGYRMMP